MQTTENNSISYNILGKFNGSLVKDFIMLSDKDENVKFELFTESGINIFRIDPLKYINSIDQIKGVFSSFSNFIESSTSNLTLKTAREYNLLINFPMDDIIKEKKESILNDPVFSKALIEYVKKVSSKYNINVYLHIEIACTKEFEKEILSNRFLINTIASWKNDLQKDFQNNQIWDFVFHVNSNKTENITPNIPLAFQIEYLKSLGISPLNICCADFVQHAEELKFYVQKFGVRMNIKFLQ